VLESINRIIPLYCIQITLLVPLLHYKPEMKFFTFTTILAASSAALAQSVSFSQPASGASLTTGTPFNVQVSQSVRQLFFI
jgi:hypothetical protein